MLSDSDFRGSGASKTIYHLLLVSLVLASGCQSISWPARIGPPQGSTPITQESNSPASVPSFQEASPSQGCYYVWATRDLPELSATLNGELSSRQTSLQGSAYAFGEECRAESGEVTFLAMETDFRVRAAFSTLEDEAALGNAIRAAMLIIDSLPAAQLVGTRPGRVDFEFAGGSQSLRLTVDIGRYKQEAAALQGAALFRYFRPPG